MADEIELKISGPVSIVAEAASRIVVAIFENDSKHRETMSPAMRDKMDAIKAQAYWDFRAVLQKLKLVDEVKVPNA